MKIKDAGWRMGVEDGGGGWRIRIRMQDGDGVRRGLERVGRNYPGEEEEVQYGVQSKYTASMRV